jgi:hypothetical protein
LIRGRYFTAEITDSTEALNKQAIFLGSVGEIRARRGEPAGPGTAAFFAEIAP